MELSIIWDIFKISFNYNWKRIFSITLFAIIIIIIKNINSKAIIKSIITGYELK